MCLVNLMRNVFNFTCRRVALLDTLLADVIDASCKFDMAMLQVLEFGKKS